MDALKISFFAPPDGLLLPLAHAEVLQGVFYRLLSEAPALSEAVHNRPQLEGRQYKLFCFGDIRGKCAVQNGQCLYTGLLSWELRSVYDFITETVEDALVGRPTLEFNNQRCAVVSCTRQHKNFFTEKYLFSAASPVTVHRTEEDGHTIFFAPTDPAFAPRLLGNLAGKYRLVSGNDLPTDTQLQCVAPESFSKVVTRYKNTIITGYTGRFELRASPSVFRTVYYAGLGEKNAMGFGLIECSL